MRNQVDKLLNKWVSRKLMVFVVATLGMFSERITSSDWVVIATAYVGVVGFYEIVEKIKSNQH